MSQGLNRGVWRSVESKTLRLLESNCTFTGAGRFVITGTIPGNTRTKMLQIESTFQNSFGMLFIAIRHMQRKRLST